MKNILFLIFILQYFIASACFSQDLLLKGRVKSIQIDIDKSFPNKYYFFPFLFSSTFFDEKGNITTGITGSRKDIYTNFYDQKNRLKRVERKHENGRTSYVNRYQYDQKDNLINETCFLYDKLSSIQTYIYNRKNQKIASFYYDRKGKLISNKIYRYNNNNDLINEIWYFKDGRISNTVFVKDEKGNTIQYYGSNLPTMNRIKKNLKGECFYDDEGNLVKEIDYGSKSTTTTIYKKDKEGNEINERSYEDRSNPLNSKFTISKNVYEYDSLGMWTLHERYIDGKLDEKTVRKIEYYY